MSPPLAEQLVRHAAGSHFPRTLEIIGQMLLEILAVPTEAEELFLALLKNRMKLVRDGCLPNSPCPGFPGPERGQIITADESCHPVQGFIVCVPLIIL